MIDFSGKTYANILSEQLSRVPDDLDKREGSIVQTALGPESWYLEGVYMDMHRLQDNVYAGTAGGGSLDRIAEAYGITRKPATYAHKQGVFNVQVPIGFRVSAIQEEHIIYRAVGYMGATDGLHTYDMECERHGEIGNGYTGQLLPIDYAQGLTSAMLTIILSAGTEEESDNALRARLLNAIQKPSTSGNRYDYYNWAMECEGVGAAKVFPLAGGPGTVKVIIADANMSAAGTGLLKTVREHIEELRPIGADVTVASVVEKAVNVSAGIKLQAGMNLGVVQNAFQAALTDYLHREALDMSYVSLARVGNLLLGTDGVEDYSGLLLNGVSGNMALTEEEIAVTGTVTLEVG
jgi:uncharacterized phage protein gp47/JayE|nr:MAG TPA: Baseplate J like protein [Caudoviricetes sp.]